MLFTENLTTLKIHKLSQEQYNRELESGNIDETALYLTPDEEIDLSGYALTSDVESYVNTRFAEILPLITESDDGKVLQVVDGKFALVELNFSKIYVGVEEPTSATSGDENDLYIQLDGNIPAQVDDNTIIDNGTSDGGDEPINNEESVDENTPATEG